MFKVSNKGTRSTPPDSLFWLSCRPWVIVLKFRYIVWSNMDYHIIGFFIFWHWYFVLVKLISVFTTKRFNINASIWQTLFKFILKYFVQMAVTHNRRFFLFFGSNSCNVVFHSSWKFWGVEYILIFWIFIGNYKRTFRIFLQILRISSRRSCIFITTILFSNVIPFNLGISFCT